MHVVRARADVVATKLGIILSDEFLIIFLHKEKSDDFPGI